MTPIFFTLLSVAAVSMVSLVGAALLPWSEKRQQGLLYIVSFAAGALFGDIFLHLLPEAIEEVSDPRRVFFLVLCGVVLMFITEKIIHWHHCHHPHEHGTHTDHHGTTEHLAGVVLFGDGAHNLIDGMIIAASFLISVPVGIATTLAVILHEIPQEIGDFAVLLHTGMTKRRALLLNLCTALTAVVGGVIGLVFGERVDGFAATFVPIAGGTLLYIAGSDLIPELHKEVGVGKSVIQLVAFLSGIGTMALLLLLG